VNDKPRNTGDDFLFGHNPDEPVADTDPFGVPEPHPFGGDDDAAPDGPDEPAADDEAENEAENEAEKDAAAKKKAAAKRKRQRAAAKKKKDAEADEADEAEKDGDDDGDEELAEMDVDDEGESIDIEIGATPEPPTDVRGQVLVPNAAVSAADIDTHTGVAELLDTAKTRLLAKLADTEATAAFGGHLKVQAALANLAYIALNPDLNAREAQAREALDATYP
jgi:hypothetical protein